MAAQRLVIACGGTGGHLFPGIAVAQAARQRGWESLILISEKQIDVLATEGHADLQFAKVPAIAMPSPLSPAFPKFLWRFIQTRRHCIKIVKNFRATAVLGMGGFTSLPPAMAGRKLKLRTLIHESNAVPGKANKLTARFCDRVLLGLQACAPYFPSGKTMVTGTPIRTALLAPVDMAEADAFFGLQRGKRTILIMGGSQGARGVNRAVIESLPAFTARAGEIQLIHITGPGEYDAIRSAHAACPQLQTYVAPFCQRMELAYSVADVAVSRSGASSLTELSVFGIPTVMIPYPTAADDHQRRNADVFTKANAALAMEEDTLRGEALAGALLTLLSDQPRREAMAARMRALAPQDAANRICDAIIA